MKLTSGLTRYINSCTSPINQQVLSLRILPEQDMLLAGKRDNLTDNFQFYKDEKPALERPDKKKDDINLASKSSDIDMRSGRTPQARLLKSESSLFLKEVRFHDQELAVDTHIYNINYNYTRLQNNKFFYSFMINSTMDQAKAMQTSFYLNH